MTGSDFFMKKLDYIDFSPMNLFGEVRNMTYVARANVKEFFAEDVGDGDGA